jgi:hypothetical protein
VDWLNRAWLQCYDKSQRQLQMSTEVDRDTLFQKAQSLESQLSVLRKELASKAQQLQVGAWQHRPPCVGEHIQRETAEHTRPRERRLAHPNVTTRSWHTP